MNDLQLAYYYGTLPELEAKEAGALDIAGRVAAAAVLLKLLDSQKRHRQEVMHAEQELGPTLRDLERQQMLHVRQGVRMGDFTQRPRLFVPASETPELQSHDRELVNLRRDAGFVPNVPMGMDDGMVRLASLQKEATILPRFQNWARGALATGAQAVAATGTQLAGGAQHLAGKVTNMAGAGANMAANAQKSQQAFQTANAAQINGPGLIHRARTSVADAIRPAPHVPAGTVPAGTTAAVAGGAAPTAPTAPLAPGALTGAPTSPPTPKPAGTSRGMQLLGMLPGAAIAGVGVAGAYGLTKATGAALDYAEKEPAPTSWGMQPYGAATVSQNINAYGQAVRLGESHMPFAHNIGTGLLGAESGSHLMKARSRNGGVRSEVSVLGKHLRDLGLVSLVLEEFIDTPTADVDAFLTATLTLVTALDITTMDGASAAGIAHPRNVTVTTAGADGIYEFPFDVVITGTLRGLPQTETITVTEGASPGTFAGAKLFDKVTRVQIPANANTDAGATVAVGFGTGIGLKYVPVSRAGLRTAVREIANGAVVTNGVFNAYGLYTPNTVPNGSVDYAVFYEADVSNAARLGATQSAVDELLQHIELVLPQILGGLHQPANDPRLLLSNHVLQELARIVVQVTPEQAQLRAVRHIHAQQPAPGSSCEQGLRARTLPERTGAALRGTLLLRPGCVLERPSASRPRGSSPAPLRASLDLVGLDRARASPTRARAGSR